jgi:GntR family transcriptional regulator / MocR family aminotransferase
MTLARRQSLLSWAEQHNAAIIEDDYDGEFRFGGRPVDALQTLDNSGRVVYVGSFSKVLLPTLRLGFIITPPSLSRAVEGPRPNRGASNKRRRRGARVARIRPPR